MTIQTMKDFGIGAGQLFIGGRWVEAAGRDRREIRNPATEAAVDAVPSSNLEDADLANYAASARNFGLAFPMANMIVMSHSPPEGRKAIIHTVELANEL